MGKTYFYFLLLGLMGALCSVTSAADCSPLFSDSFRVGEKDSYYYSSETPWEIRMQEAYLRSLGVRFPLVSERKMDLGNGEVFYLSHEYQDASSFHYGIDSSTPFRIVMVKRGQQFYPIAVETTQKFEADQRTYHFVISLLERTAVSDSGEIGEKLRTSFHTYETYRQGRLEGSDVHYVGSELGFGLTAPFGKNFPGMKLVRYPEFPGVHPLNTPTSQAMYRTVIDLIQKGESGLEMGMGSGFFSNVLAKRGVKMDGVDVDANKVRAAEIGAVHYGVFDQVRYWQSDVFSSVTGKYDFVVATLPIPSQFKRATGRVNMRSSLFRDRDRNRFDRSGRINRDFLNQLANHLNPGGRAYAMLVPEVIKTMLPEGLKAQLLYEFEDGPGKYGIYEIRVRE